jgi:AcrR family transcriptional regulator
MDDGRANKNLYVGPSMSTHKNEKPVKPTKAPRGDQKRKLILKALRDCIIKNGYAKTTLADIAETASMYPSHLLYYFKGKDAILEYYFRKVSDQILERIESFRSEPPQQQIDLLTELFFAGDGITKSEIGFMLECFGVAVNDKVLRKEKSLLDEKCKDYLIELFSSTPMGLVAGAKDSAEVTYALLIGLRSAVYFDDKLNLEDAYRLFRTTVLSIAGYPRD